MQQQKARSILIEPGLENVHGEPVAVIEQTRPDDRLWLAMIEVWDHCGPLKTSQNASAYSGLSHAAAKVSTAR
jgi:hypothetical protein